MKRWISAALAAGFCVGVSAHDGGVSTLQLCRGDTTVKVTWELHEAAGVGRNWVELKGSRGAQQVTAFERAGQHNVKLSWSFAGLNVDDDLELTAVGLAQLPHGHRVLATSCDGSRRAVLSQWQDRWLLPTEASAARAQAASTPTSIGANGNHR
ncbi:MAG: hypothetical protein AAGB27_04910 [Pseudomonadota bacterium]